MSAEVEKEINKIIKESGKPKYQKLSDILKYIIDYCGIDAKKYMIIGSFSIRKKREISDLDMNMDSKEWEKLKKLSKMGIGIIEEYNNQMRYFLDMTAEYQKVDSAAKDFSIEIFQKEMNVGFPNNDFSIKYLLDHDGLDKDDNGHMFFSIKTLLKWKKTMNREKDQPDIVMLKEMVKETTGAGERKRKTRKVAGKKKVPAGKRTSSSGKVKRIVKKAVKKKVKKTK
jgi:hypothetical protein